VDLPAGINLLAPDVAHPSTATDIWGTMEGWYVVRDVTVPTLAPVLPPAGRGNGTAVIVAPGGGFLSLSMGTEGFAVAKWLAARGTAAFVLKYRLQPTPVDPQAYDAVLRAKFGKVFAGQKLTADDLKVPDDALADAQAAIRLVRARAAAWHIDPARVGMIGFSAGAMLALRTALASPPDVRPNFIAPIYPPLLAVDATANSPPMFVAIAADDPLFGSQGFGLIQSWQKVKRPVELHFYQRGSHGFGMRHTGTTSEDFIVSFQHWMDMNGWTGASVSRAD
jgi:acetyl esterase/lipase